MLNKVLISIGWSCAALFMAALVGVCVLIIAIGMHIKMPTSFFVFVTIGMAFALYMMFHFIWKACHEPRISFARNR